MSYLSSISGFLRKKPNPIRTNTPVDYFKAHVLKLENNLDTLIELAASFDYDFNEFEEKVSKLEVKLNECIEEASHTDLFWKIEELIETLTNLKKETNFFENENTQDLSFPNRIDADFDEESIPSDSVYGD